MANLNRSTPLTTSSETEEKGTTKTTERDTTMSSVAFKPNGADWELDVNSPGPTFIFKVDKNAEMVPLKPAKFSAPTEEERQQAKVESDRIVREEIRKYWPMYLRAWTHWVAMEKAAGRTSTFEIDPDLYPGEKKRIAGIGRFFEFLFSLIPKYIVEEYSVNDKRHPVEKLAMVPKVNNLVGPAMLLDKDGILFMYRLPAGSQIAELGLPDFELDELAWDEKLVQAFLELHEEFPRKFKDTGDNRYTYHDQEANYYKNHPESPWKTFHFGCWPQTGMASTLHDPHQIGPYNLIPTEDSCGGEQDAGREERMYAANRFQRKVLQAETVCGMALWGADQTAFKEHRAHREVLESAYGMLRPRSFYQNSTLHVVLENQAVEFHIDEYDAEGNWAQTVPCGAYVGSDECLHLCDAIIPRFQLQRGDLVGVLSKIVPHGITPFLGNRFCNLFTSKSNTKSQQNVRYEEDMAKKSAIDEKKRKKQESQEAREAEERELIKEYKNTPFFDENDRSSADYHKLKDVPDAPNKLEKGRKRKRADLAEAGKKLAAEEEGWTTGRLEDLRKKPASLFYELGKMEEKSYMRGGKIWRKKEEQRGYENIYEPYLTMIRAKEDKV